MAALAYTLGKREINYYFSVRSAKALALGAVLVLTACHAASRRYRGEGAAAGAPRGAAAGVQREAEPRRDRGRAGGAAVPLPGAAVAGTRGPTRVPLSWRTGAERAPRCGRFPAAAGGEPGDSGGGTRARGRRRLPGSRAGPRARACGAWGVRRCGVVAVSTAPLLGPCPRRVEQLCGCR